MLPNDVFKRPGPHHAYEVDPEMLARLRAAIDPFEELGDASALAALLGRPPEELHDGYTLSQVSWHCLVGEDFGLRDYGPMFSWMNVCTELGEPLIARRDPCVDPISHVWFELSPYFPQRVAPAATLFVDLDLREPPAAAWDDLLREMASEHDLFQEDDETDEAFELRIAAWTAAHTTDNRALLARWRVDCRAEVEAFLAKLRELGDRGGLVATWSSDQGWL